MSRLRCPSMAAMASRLIPRLMAWVAGVCRSWQLVDVGQPGGGAGLAVVAGHGVPAGGLAVLPRQRQRVGRVDMTGAVVIDQRDQVRVQRQVAVLAELADRDMQPG